MSVTLTALGVRGSIPVSGEEFLKYGGETTCYVIETDTSVLVVDAGTGFMNLPKRIVDRERLTLILTHTHLDHVLGLPMCPFVFNRNHQLDIYEATRMNMTTFEQVNSFLQLPTWPVNTDGLPAEIRCHELGWELQEGDIHVRRLDGSHPGGVSVLIIEAEDKKITVATDCTYIGRWMDEVTATAKGSDIILCDGQYVDEEWPRSSTFGHSTWRMAIDFAEKCNAKAMRIVHHDPLRTDSQLDGVAEQVRAINPAYDLLKRGDVITL